MILRRVTLEHYGCFGSGEFEFRRGLNLVSGGNETGKSLLLSVVPAVMFGVEHGMRLRSWGDSLSCRATLLFETADRSLRLTRELENNLVRIEERDKSGQWHECFAGRVLPGGNSPERGRYVELLRRLLGMADTPVPRALTAVLPGGMLINDDGRLSDGIVANGAGGLPSMTEPATKPTPNDSDRKAEIAALEAELATDREEYRKGQEYLTWIRTRWEKAGQKKDPAAKRTKGGTPSLERETAALERQRRDLADQLRESGLPAQLPGNLPELLATAEKLRQELAVLQQELAPLQRRRQAVLMPRVVWPLLVTLVAGAAPGIAYLLRSPWLLYSAFGGAALLLLAWGLFLVRLQQARKVRSGLDREIEALETKRAEALTRQTELAERFESGGLPSSPVDMVKLQQLCQRHQTLIDQYRDICAQLGVDVPNLPAGEPSPTDNDRHLRPEDLPEAERRLAELGDSLKRREERLKALHSALDTPVADAAETSPTQGLTLPALLAELGPVLDRLTGGRYREVRLVNGCFHLEGAPGQWVPPGACSRGTIEALELGLRLVLGQLSGLPVPLLIDELPAAFDPRRRQGALRVLDRYAADHQVLLASCDEELARRAARERWHLINLNLTLSPTHAEEEPADAGQLHLL